MSKIIIQNGNMCELDLPLKFAQKLYNEFAIRHPNAFYYVQGKEVCRIGTVRFITSLRLGNLK